MIFERRLDNIIELYFLFRNLVFEIGITIVLY